MLQIKIDLLHIYVYVVLRKSMSLSIARLETNMFEQYINDLFLKSLIIKHEYQNNILEVSRNKCDEKQYYNMTVNRNVVYYFFKKWLLIKRKIPHVVRKFIFSFLTQNYVITFITELTSGEAMSQQTNLKSYTFRHMSLNGRCDTICRTRPFCHISVTLVRFISAQEFIRYHKTFEISDCETPTPYTFSIENTCICYRQENMQFINSVCLLITTEIQKIMTKIVSKHQNF